MIRFTRAGERDFRKLDSAVQKKVARTLRGIENHSKESSHVKKLQGQKNLYRLRVGDYRVVYEVIRGEIVVSLIAHRRDVYKKARRRGDY